MIGVRILALSQLRRVCVETPINFANCPIVYISRNQWYNLFIQEIRRFLTSTMIERTVFVYYIVRFGVEVRFDLNLTIDGVAFSFDTGDGVGLSFRVNTQ